LDFYDPDERGYITMKDLLEWLESLELIRDDDEDDKLLQIVVMYVYKKTNMSSQELRTFHILKLIFPDYLIEGENKKKQFGNVL
jgi:Ca2+-binding EF-hand superfamily protein